MAKILISKVMHYSLKNKIKYIKSMQPLDHVCVDDAIGTTIKQVILF